MDKKIYRNTKYPGIKQNIKNEIILSICSLTEKEVQYQQ